MGLPEINIEFRGRAVSAVQRSERGIVALIIRDENNFLNDIISLRSIEEVEEGMFNEKNRDYISKTFMGTPAEVKVLNIGSEASVMDGLSKLKSKRWNYLAVPFTDEEEGEVTTDIASFIINQRTNNKKTFKAVLAHEAADNEGIINFTTQDIRVGERTYSTSEYTPRIAGVLAGLPFTRSATYYVFNEIDSIAEHEDPDKDIDNGELIFIDDGENIKIGRGVNSFTETTTQKTEDWKSIRIVEVMDMVKDDIRSTFDNEYVGKVNNIYDNQVLFIRAVNAYFTELAGQEILDPNAENRAEINVEAQRLAWEGIGTDTTDWDDEKVKEMSFKRNVFLRVRNFKIVDTMEDLDFDIFV